MERILHREFSELLDQVAASVPEGGLSRLHASNPSFKARLDKADAQLAAARAALLEGYGRWRRALEDVENLWALTAWRSTAAEASTDTRSPAQPAPSMPRGQDRP